MTINVPYRFRLALYIITSLLTPVTAYMYTVESIGDAEVALWSAIVTVVSGLAAFNTVPTKGEKK